MSVCALVLATGERVPAGATLSVPFVRVGGVALLVRAVRAMLRSTVVDSVIVLVEPIEVERTRRLLDDAGCPVQVCPADGWSPDRWPVPHDVDLVLVHETNRPLAPATLVAAVVSAARSAGAVVVPVLPVSDTIKLVDDAGRVLGSADRGGLREVQTPLAVPAELLRGLGSPRGPARRAGTGQVGGGVLVRLLDRLSGPLHTVPGDPLAFPVRTEWDLLVAESLV